MTAFGGLAAFFVAGAAGLMYLVANHRLRSKDRVPGTRLGSLERLEHMTLASVTLGFALLTIALITGWPSSPAAIGNFDGRALGDQPQGASDFGIWVVYAVVLHSPINPSFRGRRTAMLSILGLILCLGAVVAVQFMQESR
jgi:ABC-type transport system involved in cytochrome c biogenesis permease subunit